MSKNDNLIDAGDVYVGITAAAGYAVGALAVGAA